jgi:GntR family transcriptional regulator/MocR family aminotransferase
MTRRSAAAFAFVELDRESPVPLYQQLYAAFRGAILAGRLPPGTILPSTRSIADDLRVSRNTGARAFEQLLAEGYVVGRVGSGTYVAEDLPEECLATRAGSEARSAPESAAPRLSVRGERLASAMQVLSAAPGAGYPFRAGTPALDAFPYEVWSRLVAKRRNLPPREVLGWGDPAGYEPLRAAIADYLGAARGVRCDAEQVIVVAGSQQAIDVAARLLLDPGDAAWMEEPGYAGARASFLGAGLKVVPVPVDGEGLDVAAAIARAPRARMAYVAPSHQFPLGGTMGLARRLALLEWAERAGAWIVEDDYDSEYRYAGRPLAALQGLDRGGRVIYLGTFSKVLFPALRLAYLVVPRRLAGAFRAARLLDAAPTFEQMVLADFIAGGHFVRHIRRMRALYAARQAALVREAARSLGGRLRVEPSDAGMHLIGWLPEGADDAAVARAAAERGVEVLPLSSFYACKPGRPGVLLGYACVNERDLAWGIARLARALAATPAAAAEDRAAGPRAPGSRPRDARG